VVGTYRRFCVRNNTILHYAHTLCEKAGEKEISLDKAQKTKHEIRNKHK